MVKQTPQNNKNSANLFLNEYFNIIVFFAMIFIFFIAYIFVIGPKFTATKNAINDNIETEKKLYAEQVKKLRDLKTIKDVYDKISPADLKKFDSVLPDKYVQERLFGEFEELVIQNGFLINSVNIINEEEGGDGNSAKQPMPTMGVDSVSPRLGEISVDVSISAIDYAGFKSMLKNLEANLRLFNIKSVDFSEGGKTANIMLVTYYYKPLE